MKDDLRDFRHFEDCTINGIKCRIEFYGSHYCGYIIDKRKFDLPTDPQGGWTGGYGFDCAHAGDITLKNGDARIPYTPTPTCSYIFETFKTRQFVWNELDRLTHKIKLSTNKQ